MRQIMKSEKAMSLCLLAVSTLLGAIGELLFKYSFIEFGSFAIIMSAGVLAYAVSTVIYFYVLSRAHLSWAYGIGGLSYVFVVALAHFVLLESIPPMRLAGVLVITVGVLMISAS